MIESIVKWGMCAMMAFGSLMVIGAVGKPRGPITGATAAFVTAVNALWITAIIAFWN